MEIEHPAPWRWERDPDRAAGIGQSLFAADMKIVGSWYLLDANGRRLVDKEMVFHLDGEPSLRALIAAAPEMEELLRTFVNCVAPLPVRNLDLNLGTAYSRASALLARIDGAK